MSFALSGLEWTPENIKEIGHCIYFLQEKGGAVKIGCTIKDLHSRLAPYYSHNGGILVIGVIIGIPLNRIPQSESCLLNRFAHCRLSNLNGRTSGTEREWFAPNPDLLCYARKFTPEYWRQKFLIMPFLVQKHIPREKHIPRKKYIPRKEIISWDYRDNKEIWKRLYLRISDPDLVARLPSVCNSIEYAERLRLLKDPYQPLPRYLKTTQLTKNQHGPMLPRFYRCRSCHLRKRKVGSLFCTVCNTS